MFFQRMVQLLQDSEPRQNGTKAALYFPASYIPESMTKGQIRIVREVFIP